MTDRCGQSTVEYLLVLVAFVSLLAAFGLVWQAARSGALVGLATRAASHGAGQGLPALLKDIAVF